MLRHVKDLEDYKITATDGDIGKVSDFYFDDEYWTIRYLVANTAGLWEPANRVLVSPIAFREADFVTQRFHLNLTRDKVRNSPSVDLEKPVSRQYEREYFQYYNWPYYWGYGGIWGSGQLPGPLAVADGWREGQEQEPVGDPHLRSVREVRGYHIKGLDAEIGHVEDFIVDDASWTIRYLVVNTSNWWVGKSVLLAPQWIEQISWPESLVHVKLPREIIRRSPEWKSDQPIDRDYEMRLYKHYGWPTYWLDELEGVPTQPTSKWPEVSQHRT